MLGDWEVGTGRFSSLQKGLPQGRKLCGVVVRVHKRGEEGEKGVSYTNSRASRQGASGGPANSRKQYETVRDSARQVSAVTLGSALLDREPSQDQISWALSPPRSSTQITRSRVLVMAACKNYAAKEICCLQKVCGRSAWEQLMA